MVLIGVKVLNENRFAALIETQFYGTALRSGNDVRAILKYNLQTRSTSIKTPPPLKKRPPLGSLKLSLPQYRAIVGGRLLPAGKVCFTRIVLSRRDHVEGANKREASVAPRQAWKEQFVFSTAKEGGQTA